MNWLTTTAATGVLLGCIFSGCVAYQPAPLEPTVAARQFALRSLSNPRLCTYLVANLQTKLSTCPPADWNLATLTLAGFYYSPTLAVAQARVETADAAIITAGASPNPTIGLGPQYDVRSVPNFVPWAIGLSSLDVPVETAGKRGYRIAKAQRLANAARLAAGETAWAVRSRIRSALLKYLIDRQRADLSARDETVLAQISGLIGARVHVGEAARPALELALGGLEDARVKAAQTQARVRADRNALAAALGVPIRALDGARFDWPGFDHPPDQHSLAPATVQRLALLNRIGLRQQLEQYAGADEALKLEIAKQYPDLHIAGGYSWEGGENIFELGPSIVLPLFNQNQGPIAEALAHRKEVATQFVAAQSAVIAQSRAAMINYRGALAALEAARSAANHQARSYSQAARAAAVGENDALTALAALIQSLAAQQTRLDALAAAQDALGALEDSIQRPLDGGDVGTFTFPPPPAIREVNLGGR